MVLGKSEIIAASAAFGTKRGAARVRGFTLVELMITLAVAAILLMIAVPSFQRIIVSNKLTTAANSMTNGLNAARLEAIKLNSVTQFCGSTSALNTTDILGSACGTQSGAVYALPQSASTATASQVQAPAHGLVPPVQVSGDVAAVRFSGQGFGYAPGAPGTPFTDDVVVICTTELPNDNLRVVSMTAGSIVATASSTGSCP